MGKFDRVATGSVYGAAEQAIHDKFKQTEASEEEKAQRIDSMKTQGRKGCKMPRINMAYTPENHQFIKLMAKATGHTMTEFTNIVIEQYRKEHPELTEKANELLKIINSGFSSSDDDQ